MKEILIYLGFIYGLLVGSFLNVCIYRLPLARSVVFPRSYCYTCNNTLRTRDLIPIISYLALRGRCHFCGAQFSIRYAFVELLTGLFFSWCFIVFGLSSLSIVAQVFASFLIIITFIDIDHQLILDKVLIWFAGAGVIINLFTGQVAIWDMLMAALVGGGVMLVIAVITRGGMGGGDIKFLAALGLWLGLKLTVLTLFLSFVIGGVGGALLLLFRIKKRKDFIPFGPFIAIGAFVSLLYGEPIIQWYVTHFLK